MHRGNTLPPALVLTLTQSEAVPFLLALVGSCTVCMLHCTGGAQTSPTIISLGWVFPMVPSSVASVNS